MNRTSRTPSVRHWKALTGIAFAACCVGATATEPVFFQGSAYEYVPTYTTWDRAKAAAEAMSYLGFPGRLATITSPAEQQFVASLVPWGANAMIGGSDAAVEGTWVWATGPETGTIFWRDSAPYQGAYTNWLPGEPNNAQPGENYLVLYHGGWNDSAANAFLHAGYVVEYRLTASGFDFGMSADHLGAIRNIAPADHLVRLDITLPQGSYFDSAASPPGREFTAWSVIAASPGVPWTLPSNAATDGQRSATLLLDLAPTQALHFQVDLDSVDAPEGPGIASGTLLTAYFAAGDVRYTVSGVVRDGAVSILGSDFPNSVRAVAVVPEPGRPLMLVVGLGALVAVQLARRSGSDRRLAAAR
jgi:hypothetical protein